MIYIAFLVFTFHSLEFLIKNKIGLNLKPFMKSLVHYEELEGVRHDKLMFDAQIIRKINEVLDEKNI